MATWVSFYSWWWAAFCLAKNSLLFVTIVLLEAEIGCRRPLRCVLRFFDIIRYFSSFWNPMILGV